MAAILTNRGKKLLLEWALQDNNEPSTLYMALLRTGSSVGVDINTLSETDRIVVGNGYSDGGVVIPRSTGGFITLVQDDANDWATIKPDRVEFITDGGTIPASSDIRYMALTTDEATVDDRQVIAIFDLGSSITIPDGKQLAVSGATIKLSTP